MKDQEVAQGNLSTDEVNVNLNVFRAKVMDGVDRHIDNTHVLTVDDHRLSNRDVDLLTYLSHLATLGNGMGNRAVLCFHARAGDSGMAFGGPRHQIVVEEDLKT